MYAIRSYYGFELHIARGFLLDRELRGALTLAAAQVHDSDIDATDIGIIGNADSNQ